MACHSEDAVNFHGVAIDVPESFNPSQTGLGLYLPTGCQDSTPPSLAASSPDTSASWTSQGVARAVAAHPSDAKSSPWTSIFEDFTPLTESVVEWNEAIPFAPQEPCEVHCCPQGSPFQENTGPASAPLHSHRSSISSGYPSTSECYPPDGHESTAHPTPKIPQGNGWLESFPKIDMSNPMGIIHHGVISLSPPAPSLVDPYQLEANPYSQFSSTFSSLNAHQPSDIPSSGRTLRTNSLPGSVHEDLYERAKQSVARIRKRRRMSTPARASYFCHICGRGFSRNYNLQIHLPTHTPDRPKQWPCAWTGCDKVFTRRTDLVRHEKCVSASRFRHVLFSC